MLGGDGIDVLNPELVEIVDEGFVRSGIDFVDSERYRFAGFAEKLGELAIGGGELGASVDHEDDAAGVIEGDARLLQNLGGDVVGVADDNSTGIDQLEAAAFEIGLAGDAVTGDTGLVAYYGPASASDSIEKGGFADVWPTHDDDRGRLLRHTILTLVQPQARPTLKALKIKWRYSLFLAHNSSEKPWLRFGFSDACSGR